MWSPYEIHYPVVTGDRRLNKESGTSAHFSGTAVAVFPQELLTDLHYTASPIFSVLGEPQRVNIPIQSNKRCGIQLVSLGRSLGNLAMSVKMSLVLFDR